MVGGGAASMYDPLYTVQFIDKELRAAVHAATDYGTYVATHVYNVTGIRRALAAGGVKSIEHGHLADEETIALLAEKEVWLSMQPFALGDHHYPPDPGRAEKDRQICTGVENVYEWAKKHGVKTAWGTDLLLEPQIAPPGRARWQRGWVTTTATSRLCACSPPAMLNCSAWPANEIPTARPNSERSPGTRGRCAARRRQSTRRSEPAGGPRQEPLRHRQERPDRQEHSVMRVAQESAADPRGTFRPRHQLRRIEAERG